MFETQYFQSRPRPFYELSASIFPSQVFKPSYTHCFLRLLQDKNKLHYVVTQNIDDIEKQVGIKNLNQAHGSYTNNFFCMKCNYQTTQNQILNAASLDKAVSHCPYCGWVMKPNIVFFGESLGPFVHEYGNIVQASDLMIVMGTSLKVGPVNMLPYYARTMHKDRILLNNEIVEEFKKPSDQNKKDNVEDENDK